MARWATAPARQGGKPMISKFVTVYPGHIDLGDMGQDATPANERRYSNDELASVFEKTEAIAKRMDALGYDTLWLAEHHFQHEGYEVIPNILMLAVHLAHVTKKLKIGCGFNITPMWHPLRLAEDYAVADILTKGRTVFGVGRGYHTREVETFGAPMQDQNANRELFEEQVEIIFKAFNNESFSHKGKHYTLPPQVPYRGYTLKEITLVPRPVNRPVECWQPIVSANPRGLDFMVRHGIKGAVGGGAATMADGPIQAYRDAAARAGKNLELGENLTIGVFFYVANSREQAIRELTPFYEEHVKMFGPLGFVPGITPAQVVASSRRGGWKEAGVPELDHYMKLGSWFAGTPQQLIEHLKKLEQRYPGMEHINLSTSLATPKAIMLEQFQRVAEEVMPAFR
jgi:alkanesulfonate monooxygenase SsuD/methylene tetrahydromethanopterin reductase-like flavin-dependent oxidoreductase (luciferase family)